MTKKIFGQIFLVKNLEKARLGKCFCESIFGVLKSQESITTAGGLQMTADTVCIKNHLSDFLKKVQQSMKSELWETIENKTFLQEITSKKEAVKKELFQMREQIKKNDAAEESAKEERKRKREAKKNETPARKIIHPRKKLKNVLN